MPTYQPHTPSPGQGPGCQDAIQAKLVYMCQLLLGAPAGGSDEANWYSSILLNNLCAGWAAMHRVYGASMEDAWTALQAWVPASPLVGDACHDELLRLKGLLASCSQEYFSRAPDAASLKGMLVDVYRAHRAENPRAGYMEVPRSILNDRPYPTPPSVGAPAKFSTKGNQWEADVKKRIAKGARSSKYLCVALRTNGEAVHDMSVRFTDSSLVVLEPETTGVILCGTNGAVVEGLRQGIVYMKADELTIFGP